MEEKYKIINRELVLKNQNLKQTVNLLAAEITLLKEKQFEVNQHNKKLLNEINEFKNLKRELVAYTCGLSEYLTKIFGLIYPKQYSNASSGTSNEIITQIVSDFHNGASNIESEENTRSEEKFFGGSNDVSPPTVHIHQRRKHISLTSSSLSKVSNGLGQLESSPRNNTSHTSMEEKCYQERLRDPLDITELSIQSPPFMKTITEEKISSNHNSIVNYSTENSKDSVRFMKESVTLKGTSISMIPENSGMRLFTQLGPTNIGTENITISNVPCSTPYQRKKHTLNKGSDLHASLKSAKIMLKNLKLRDLEKFGVKINPSRNNGNKIFDKRKVEENEKKKENINNKEKGKIKEEIVDDNEFSNKENFGKSTSVNEFSLEKTERTIRTRGTIKCLAEPSLKVKLRRLK